MSAHRKAFLSYIVSRSGINSGFFFTPVCALFLLFPAVVTFCIFIGSQGDLNYLPHR